MVFLRWAVATAAVVAAALVVSERMNGAAYEPFAGAASGAPATLEENIADTYRDVLQRQPTSKELIADTRDLRAGTLTMRGLRQRLIDTEEYARNMKLQSNSLAPELDKALSDAELFKALKDTYKAVRGKDMPANMTLMYKDIYVYLSYNEWTFRAFLANEKFSNFEKEVLLVSDMDKETLLALFNMTFDKKALVTAGIAESEAAAKRAAGAAGAGGAGADAVPAGAAVGDKLARPADSQDPSISATISRILEGTRNGALDKDAQARILDEIQKIQNNPNLTAEEKRQAIAAIVAIANQDAVVKATTDSIMAQSDGSDYADVPTHEGDLVLRPEFAWSVPQRRPPVCNMLGQKPNVQPMYTGSGAAMLLGTPLHEAAETGVGSMMPKFAFQTYQNVPIRSQQPVACAAPEREPAMADVPAGKAATAVNAVTAATTYAK